MESSQLAQRMLIIMSLLVLGVTGAAWWWVANEPAPNVNAPAQFSFGAPELTDAPNPTGAASSGTSKLSERIDSSRLTAPEVVATPAVSPSPMRLAAYEQPPEGLQVPAAGVSVPAAIGAPLSSNGALSFKGVLAFVHDVKVVAQADGVIREFLVDEGSVVEKDAIMLEIDNRLARAEQEIARKELESAQLKAEDESQIKFAIASEEVARSDYRRTEDLYQREVANVDEYERKRLEWIKSQFSIDVSRREQKINQAAVGVSEAKLNASAVQVELRTIRAPFTGIVAKTEKENFEWVKGGDEILRLVSLEKFRVRGRVQIDDSPNILERAPAKVLVQVQPGQVETVNGIVGFVEPETSATLDGKNEYAVWVEIQNKIVNGQFLFRGKMNATVEIYPNR